MADRTLASSTRWGKRAQLDAVAFAAAIPLDGGKVMAPLTISAPVAFTVAAGAVAGGTCHLRIVADGSNMPSFSGMTEHGSSAGWFNTSGTANLIDFWHDGTTAYYAITQAKTVVPFAALSAVSPASAPNTIVITYPANLNTGQVPAASAFAVTNSGGAQAVSSVAITAANRVTLTLSRASLGGETISVAYTVPGSNPLLDTNGNSVLASSVPVTNGVLPAGVQYLSFPNLYNMVETARAEGGFDYSEAAAGGAWGATMGKATTAKKLPANQDGWLSFRVMGTGVNGPILGFALTDQTSAISTFTTSQVQFAITTGSTGNYRVVSAGTVTNATNTIAQAVGHIVRVRRVGSTGAVVAEYSTDEGATWATIHTFTPTSTADLYVIAATGDKTVAGTIARPLATTNVA